MTAGRATMARNRTYVVCLECGKEFSYDWRSMRVGEPVDKSAGGVSEPLYR
jgi:hypothetical protein